MNSYKKGIISGPIKMKTEFCLNGLSEETDAMLGCKSPKSPSFSISSLARKAKPRKQIITNVSVYFNSGELVAVMGPSGSGKTTLLDLLSGRRKDQHNTQVIWEPQVRTPVYERRERNPDSNAALQSRLLPFFLSCRPSC